MNNKISFPELVNDVAQAAGTSTRVSEVFLKELFATISQTLIDGESVTVKGLGKFGRDNKTVVFIPDTALADAVNAPFAMFEPVPLTDVGDDLLAELNTVARPAPEPDIAEEPAEEEEPTPEEPTQEDLTPPPFNPPADDENVATPLDQPEPVTESEPVIEPKVAENYEPEVKTETQRQRPSFLLGMLAGAAAMAVIALIAWALLRAPATNDTADTKPSTSVAADTVPEKTADKPAVITDTTSSKSYLTTIATRHYGRQEFWVYIYQENKDIISDPNNITPGTVVVVPPAEKYGIDPNDKESVKKAKDEAFRLLTAK